MAAALILLQACSKQAEQKPFVARVGQSALTEEDLAEAHDSLAQTPDRRREYIAEWVNAELLYQEAKRRGLTDSDRLRRQIEATTRKLVIGALLEQELYADENVSDDDVVVLYNSGADAFRLREDVANVSYALFGDRDAANGFRGKLVRNTAWTVAVEEVQKDSALKPHLLLVATRQYFTQSNLYPAELWKLAKNLARDEVSFVVKTDAGYYVLVAHSMKKQGDLPELEYVRTEIRDIILIEQRRTRYNKLLAELKSKHSVEIRLGADTISHAMR